MFTLRKSALTLTVAMSLLSACSNTYNKDDVGFFDVKTVPTYDLLEVDAFVKDTELKLKYVINDQKVYKFAFLLQDTLKKKVKQGRVGEETFSAIQVTLSAFAAAFSASTGVHVDVVTTLAGLSSLTPDIANIISAGDKAKAYSQGLDLIETAIATYIAERASAATAKSGLIPTELTAEGAALFVTSVASLKVMRDALLLTIPNADDLAKAQGKYALFSLNTNTITIELKPEQLQGASKEQLTQQKSLITAETKINQAHKVAAAQAETLAEQTVNDANTKAAQDANDLVKESDDKLKLLAEELTALETLAQTAATNNLGKLNTQAQQRNKREVIVVKGNKLKLCSSSSPAIASVQPCAGADRIEITPLAEGESVITVVSEAGEKATITVNIDAK